VPAPPPLADLTGTTVALVTTAGMVPRGNPDHQSHAVPRKMTRYGVADRDELVVGEWESVHGGFKGLIYNTVNPNYALPLPALRELERRREIGGVHSEFFSVVGANCPAGEAQRMGREIAAELVKNQVGAAILEST